MLEPLLSDKLDSVSQISGKRSRSRITSSTRHSSSSSTRRKALAEAAAAKQEEEFDQLLADKERERMEMEAEGERKRQSYLAKFVHEEAVLSANKKAALAEAKLKAIEQAIEDEDNEKITLVTIPGFTKPVDTKEQTQAWINTQEIPQKTFKTLDCVTGNTNPFDEREPLHTDACRRTRDNQSKTGCELGTAQSSKVPSGDICRRRDPFSPLEKCL